MGCWRFTKFCLVEKHVNISMKPTDSPTKGQPNTRKKKLKVAFGPLSSTANIFSWVGICFYVGNRPQESLTQPDPPQTSYLRTEWCMLLSPCPIAPPQCVTPSPFSSLSLCLSSSFCLHRVSPPPQQKNAPAFHGRSSKGNTGTLPSTWCKSRGHGRRN